MEREREREMFISLFLHKIRNKQPIIVISIISIASILSVISTIARDAPYEGR